VHNILRFLLVLYSLFLCIGCKSPIIDVRLDIVVDHQIQSSLNDNVELRDLIIPFEGDSLIINYIPIFTKIDAPVIIKDSIVIDTNWITKGQLWLGGGKKNPRFFIKTRRNEIINTRISASFEINGQQKYVDTFYKSLSSRYLVFTKDTGYVNHLLKSNLVGIKHFTSIESLRVFIFNNIDSINAAGQPIRILFNPRFKIIADTSQIVTQQEPPLSPPATLPPSPIPQPSPPLPPTTSTTEILKKKICDTLVSPLVSQCYRMPTNQGKLIFFFNKVFQFAEINSCNSSEYKSLLAQVYSYLSANPPSRGPATNVYFNMICSHKSAFTNELLRLQIPTSASELNSIYNSCPLN
jgi:hypothetical protein